MIKADGLAAGKGVVIASCRSDAFAAIDDIMLHSKFGSSCGSKVIIEEYLSGYEVSVSTTSG